ncbi:predicted protein [Botrytis cinerea T4]|uniref:Uncharacterized protein n=1 Tax=Botryotinia fuckeliana (strain T4) TaxID=999810 RepID=G2YIR1_BOTF4|nr:predicted protein [Botrytis cinerea T4]
MSQTRTSHFWLDLATLMPGQEPLYFKCRIKLYAPAKHSLPSLALLVFRRIVYDGARRSTLTFASSSSVSLVPITS